MSNLKLGVVLSCARNLIPKDGNDSSNLYVELHFDHQKSRSTTKEMQGLHPYWNETFLFTISDPNNLSEITLDAYVYSNNKDEKTKFSIGEVHIKAALFLPYSDALVLYYPFEMQSPASGELGLKVFIIDNPILMPSTPLPQVEPSLNTVVHGDKRANPHDLVEPMQFIFVRVVKARDVRSSYGSLDPYVEVRYGKHKGVTQHCNETSSPEWNTVFAFSKERMQPPVLELVVKDKDFIKDDTIGYVHVGIHDMPTQVPLDSPLAPEWYWLKDRKGIQIKGELMLAVWIGTQADEAFPDACLPDDAAVTYRTASSTFLRSKVYHSPRLSYVRVNVIEVQDLDVMNDNPRFPDVQVMAQISKQVFTTRPVQTRTMYADWNEEFIFVVAEPFDDYLIISVEDRVGHNYEKSFGKVVIPLSSFQMLADDTIVHSKWFNLNKPLTAEGEEKKKGKEKFKTRIHLRLCLDGRNHILEPTHYSNEIKLTVNELSRKPCIGILELGILKANALQPMKIRDGRGTTDAYCVAKYGRKWVRSRTIIDNFNPRFNQQCYWEVYDPSMVLTVGVFDNSHLSKPEDAKIGKLIIRIPTHETEHVYTRSYPLSVLDSSSVRKMGELHLAIRFRATSTANIMHTCSQPLLLPKMHYERPLMKGDQVHSQAVNIVAARLSRAEPPLKKDVVEYMTDADPILPDELD